MTAHHLESPTGVASQAVNPERILSVEELGSFNTRSNLKGFLHLSGHLTVMVVRAIYG
jgi:hypothetical protein